jgi:hypothetical protein
MSLQSTSVEKLVEAFDKGHFTFPLTKATNHALSDGSGSFEQYLGCGIRDAIGLSKTDSLRTDSEVKAARFLSKGELLLCESSQ